jgi:hypothetical protein
VIERVYGYCIGGNIEENGKSKKKSKAIPVKGLGGL